MSEPATQSAVVSSELVRLFPRGLPKRRPKDEYIHSTCGCWQCAYCASVKAARKRRDERLQLWDSIKKQPNIVLGQSGAKEKNANAMDKTT